MHRTDELTYAFALPRALLPKGLSVREVPCRLHRRIHDAAIGSGIVSAVDLSMARSDPAGPVSLCFSSPVRSDLLYRGRKVAGVALRAWQDRFLLQGSLQEFPVSYNQLVDILVQAVERDF